jgi:hypothetical protein
VPYRPVEIHADTLHRTKPRLAKLGRRHSSGFGQLVGKDGRLIARGEIGNPGAKPRLLGRTIECFQRDSDRLTASPRERLRRRWGDASADQQERASARPGEQLRVRVDLSAERLTDQAKQPVAHIVTVGAVEPGEPADVPVDQHHLGVVIVVGDGRKGYEALDRARRHGVACDAG